MAHIVFDMSMSIDGFIAGPADDDDHPLGEGGLPAAMARPPQHSGPSKDVFDELMATGAVISGRRTYELAGRWNGDHHDGMPVFVLTHSRPEDPPPGSVQYVTDAVECAAHARSAAGGRDVMVHGAGAGQALLRAGELDAMELHLVPVLLGDGRRLFEGLGADHIELELVRTLEAPSVVHQRYRVVG